MITYPNVKLNLGLRVLGKRPDGYHELETLFVPYFGICDVLEVKPSASGTVFSASENVNWKDDLTLRAWRLFHEEFGIPDVSIRLVKNAPVGAGLGGGSADAAFTLKMLNQIFSLGLSDENLSAYASRLGSDCPFFIYNTPMIGKGRGEILTPFPLDLTEYKIRVISPEGIRIDTAQAYRLIDEIPLDPTAESLADVLALPPEEWKEHLFNNFEIPVFAANPQLASIKQSLYEEGAIYASMSGSGSSIFGIFK